MRYDDYRRARPGRYERSEDSGLRNFGRWLGRRPAEVWGFFFVGWLIGSIFF